MLKRMIPVCALLMSISSYAQTQGVLENPTAGVVESGIGIVSGWHCTAKEVTVKVDGIDLGRSGVGSVRNDTKSVCGDVNNGFSLLFNYNDLKSGQHTLEAYADGKLLEKRVFYTIQSTGVPYRERVNQDFVSVNDFPVKGKAAVLAWRPEQQNYIVAAIATPSILNGYYLPLRTTLIKSSQEISFDTAAKNTPFVDDSHMIINGNQLSIHQKFYQNGKSMGQKITVRGFKNHGAYFTSGGEQWAVYQSGAILTFIAIECNDKDGTCTQKLNRWVKIEDGNFSMF